MKAYIIAWLALLPVCYLFGTWFMNNQIEFYTDNTKFWQDSKGFWIHNSDFWKRYGTEQQYQDAIAKEKSEIAYADERIQHANWMVSYAWLPGVTLTIVEYTVVTLIVFLYKREGKIEVRQP